MEHIRLTPRVADIKCSNMCSYDAYTHIFNGTMVKSFQNFHMGLLKYVMSPHVIAMALIADVIVITIVESVQWNSIYSKTNQNWIFVETSQHSIMSTNNMNDWFYQIILFTTLTI